MPLLDWRKVQRRNLHIRRKEEKNTGATLSEGLKSDSGIGMSKS